MPTAILFGAVDQVRAVVGRDAGVGLAGVEATAEITQQRVEVPPLYRLRLQRSAVAERQLVRLVRL